MGVDIIDFFKMNLALLQNQPLSGGIVAKNLRISDNGSGGTYVIWRFYHHPKSAGSYHRWCAQFKQPDDFYPAGDNF